MEKKPNFLIILTDEERYPPEWYESEEVKNFRKEQCTNREWLMANGATFHKHYVASTACVPSRASLFTGHYPSLHGVDQTDGIAKTKTDVQWLEKNTVPTMGNFMKCGGYDSAYKGKFHIQDINLYDENGHEIQTVNKKGDPILDQEAKYLDANLLQDFGFDSIIGPEPHGASELNSGTYKDPNYARQTINWINSKSKEFKQKGDIKPFIQVCSLVNPHDIVLFPKFVNNNTLPNTLDDTIPNIGITPTDDEDLSKKPSVQKQYQKRYRNMYGPDFLLDKTYEGKNLEKLRKFYYYLLKQVDKEIGKVLAALKESPFFDNTYVVFTADHGDLLGAHGGLQQKWFQMYEEAIHVPLTICGPGIKPNHIHNICTSHVDILPTLLHLAKLDERDIRQKLESIGFSEVHQLVGRSLKNLILDVEDVSNIEKDERAVYFMTDDRITSGSNQNYLIFRPFKLTSILKYVFNLQFDSVYNVPSSIEAIVVCIDGVCWKFGRYWDNAELWTDPNNMDEYQILTGPRRGEMYIKVKPLASEYEMYNITEDPCEKHNIVENPVFYPIRSKLMQILQEERIKKRKSRNEPLKRKIIKFTSVQKYCLNLSKANVISCLLGGLGIFLMSKKYISGKILN